MSNGVGIIKEIDKLGRMVIPKEFRERFCFESTVELVLTTEGILIRSPKYELTERGPWAHNSGPLKRKELSH